jgi:hypothetical protein
LPHRANRWSKPPAAVFPVVHTPYYSYEVLLKND